MKYNRYLVVNSSVAEGFSQVHLGVAHTLVPCAPFTPPRASEGAWITSWVHITGSLRYWMLHEILKSTFREKAQETSVCEQQRRHQLPRV